MVSLCTNYLVPSPTLSAPEAHSPQHRPEAESRNSASWVTYVAIFALGLAFAYVIGSAHPRADGEIRLAAGILELMGIGSVALGIADIRQQFKLNALSSEVRTDLQKFIAAVVARLRRLLGLRTHAIAPVTGVVAHAELTVSAHGRGKVRPGPQASLEERVQSLERLVDGLQDAVWRGEDDLLRETTERKKALERERTAREGSYRDLRQTIHEYAVGGVRLEIVGLVWLAVGVCLATLAPEIAPYW